MLFELVYRWIRYHKKKRVNLFIETQCSFVLLLNFCLMPPKKKDFT